MRRICLKIMYDGSNYFGWQNQPNKDTIQKHIETALSNVLKENIIIYASGRTDVGVHALCQVAHVDTNSNIKCFNLIMATNRLLPEDIKIFDAFDVDSNFHARFSAKRKTYVYKVYVSRTQNPFLYKKAFQIYKDVDINKMKDASKYLIGEHDFSAFCKKDIDNQEYTRTIYSITINRQENEIDFEICGNGFLHNMVRIIVSTLLDVGRNKISIEEFNQILQSKDRTRASKTIAGDGLYLKNVEYE